MDIQVSKDVIIYYIDSMTPLTRSPSACIDPVLHNCQESKYIRLFKVVVNNSSSLICPKLYVRHTFVGSNRHHFNIGPSNIHPLKRYAKCFVCLLNESLDQYHTNEDLLLTVITV